MKRWAVRQPVVGGLLCVYVIVCVHSTVPYELHQLLPASHRPQLHTHVITHVITNSYTTHTHTHAHTHTAR